MNGILGSTEVIAAVIGTILAFVFGIIATYLTQYFSERKLKAEINYTKFIEAPLILTKNELKDNIRVSYQATELIKPYYYRLTITNAGRKLIRKQAFTCIFPSQSRLVDLSSFPIITYQPIREVGPIINDSSNQRNEFRYIIEKLGFRQTIVLEFLTTDNNSGNFDSSGNFDVIFAPNEEQEVTVNRGSITNLPSIEKRVWQVLTSIIVFILLKETSNIALLVFNINPAISASISTVIGIPALFFSLKLFATILTEIRNTVKDAEPSGYQYEIIGDVGTLQQISVYSNSTVGSVVGTLHDYSPTPKVLSDQGSTTTNSSQT
jgi:hypothetical protein